MHRKPSQGATLASTRTRCVRRKVLELTAAGCPGRRGPYQMPSRVRSAQTMRGRHCPCPARRAAAPSRNRCAACVPTSGPLRAGSRNSPCAPSARRERNSSAANTALRQPPTRFEGGARAEQEAAAGDAQATRHPDARRQHESEPARRRSSKRTAAPPPAAPAAIAAARRPGRRKSACQHRRDRCRRARRAAGVRAAAICRCSTNDACLRLRQPRVRRCDRQTRRRRPMIVRSRHRRRFAAWIARSVATMLSSSSCAGTMKLSMRMGRRASARRPGGPHTAPGAEVQSIRCSAPSRGENNCADQGSQRSSPRCAVGTQAIRLIRPACRSAMSKSRRRRCCRCGPSRRTADRRGRPAARKIAGSSYGATRGSPARPRRSARTDGLQQRGGIRVRSAPHRPSGRNFRSRDLRAGATSPRSTSTCAMRRTSSRLASVVTTAMRSLPERLARAVAIRPR